MKRSLLLCAVLVAASAAPVRADIFYPMVMGINPVAVQAGATIKTEVRSRYSLFGAYQVVVTGEGVTAVADAPPTVKAGAARPDVTQLGITFTATPDATPGIRDVRIMTAQGASTLGQILVVREPVVAEKGKHATLATAQQVKLPAALCGTVTAAEEVDVYKFTAQAGEAYTFLCHAQRLENKIHDLQTHIDPILTLKDESGTVLAEIDNTHAGDPRLHYAFTRPGDYYLEVRDVRYEGNAFWYYCVEASKRPFATAILPVAVPPGQTTLNLTGYNLPADVKGTISIPTDAAEGLRYVTVTTSAGPIVNPVAVWVSRSAMVAESNDAGDSVATAQKLAALPTAVSGRLEKDGDKDVYSFTAKKGEVFTFSFVSRGCDLAPDPNLRLLNDKDKTLVENDDYRDRHTWPDPKIETWSAPADGTYALEVRDLHRRGGPDYVYALTIERAGQQFVLDLDTDKTLLAPGLTAVLFARVTRKGGFAGPVDLTIEGLPKGVSASCGQIPAGMTDGSILLTCAKDAKLTAANVRVTGTAELLGPDGKPTKTVVEARPLQEIYMPGGGRYYWPAELHTVSVADDTDIESVRITPANVTLKPGESKKIEVEIVRKKGFASNVTLDVNYRHLGSVFGQCLPPGVTVDERASLTALTGGKTKGHIVLKADPKAAPVENHQVAVMAHVSINFVMKFTYCGEPLKLTITK